MNDSIVLQTQAPLSVNRGDVVLITHADTDRGYRLACQFLADGVRVVVTARHAAALTRILHGHNTTEVMAIAADVDYEGQLAAVLSRAESRLGHVSAIVDGRSHALPGSCVPTIVQSRRRLARTATKPPPMTSAMPR